MILVESNTEHGQTLFAVIFNTSTPHCFCFVRKFHVFEAKRKLGNIIWWIDADRPDYPSKTTGSRPHNRSHASIQTVHRHEWSKRTYLAHTAITDHCLQKKRHQFGETVNQSVNRIRSTIRLSIDFRRHDSDSYITTFITIPYQLPIDP